MKIKDLLINKSPLIMGILNVTPDSFSDGSKYNSLDRALKHADQMINSGADIIDIGGESTRPGAEPVALDKELERVIPVINKIRENFDIPISIDTSKAQVMTEAINAGADMINDVMALQGEGSLNTAAALQVPVCLMHMQGTPETMQKNPVYEDLLSQVDEFFKERIQICLNAGIELSNLIIDPGFGFGKTIEHNLILLDKLATFRHFNLPILVGLSRKSLLHKITAKDVEQRMAGSLALALIAAQKGADIIRVHDVDETDDVLKVLSAIKSLKD